MAIVVEGATVASRFPWQLKTSEEEEGATHLEPVALA